MTFKVLKRIRLVLFYINMTGSSTFEVEFVDENLQTIDVVTVPEINLRLSQEKETSK
jgi:hypothetical protein